MTEKIEFELVNGPQDGGKIRFDNRLAVLVTIYTSATVDHKEYVSWKAKETRGYCICYVKNGSKFHYQT